MPHTSSTKHVATKPAVKTICLLLLCLSALAIAGCATQQETYTSFDQLAGKRIGYLTGTINEPEVVELAGSDGTTLGFNSGTDLAVALENNKIDAYAADEVFYVGAKNEFTDQVALKGYLVDLPYAALFKKNDPDTAPILKQFNQFVADRSADGTLQAIQEEWFSGGEPDVDLPGETGTNGTLTIAISTSSAGKPDNYYKNGEHTGWETDIISRFANEYGYGVKFMDTDFSGLLSAVASGQADFAMCDISVTEERAESFDFSDPYYLGGTVMVVKDSSAASNSVNIVESLATSFQRTFIQENRWQMFASGVATTLEISLVSIVLGTLSGFLVYMLCRRFNRHCRRFVDACIWLISGMPTVVLLMVLFYIIFAAIDIDATATAIIAFTLIFGASVVGMLRMGVDAVDKGQAEAAKAMGYSRRQGFLRIVLPQAVNIVIPTYQSEAIGLLKGTAVVGYIAVQDLTKMGDIVRSATYEAFFPLIAVAVMYFVLEGLVKLTVKWISKRLGPEHRTEAKVLKGTKDASMVPIDHGKHDVSVEFCHMGKDFGTAAPLKDVCAKVNSGDVIAVIGGSGCGKSTMLRCLNLLDPPTSGTILLDGEDIMARGPENPEVNKHIGMVFQRWNLFTRWTVVENVMLPQVHLLGRTRAQAYAYAMSLLESVGMAEKALAFPAELSGGQQQRVAIARTLAMDPDMILMDEPTSALDPEMVAEVDSVMVDLAAQGRTMMIVTHDMTLAENVANRVFFLAEGVIYEDGTAEQLFNDPHGETTKRFINRQKTLVMDEAAGSFDLTKQALEIDAFCRKNRIPAHANMVMILGLEKLAYGIANRRAPEGTPLQVEIMYALKTHEGEMTVRHQGEALDVTDDELSFEVDNNFLIVAHTRPSSRAGFDQEIFATFVLQKQAKG